MANYFLKDGLKDKSWVIANIGIIFAICYITIILLSWVLGLLTVFGNAPHTRFSTGVLVVMGLAGCVTTAKGDYSGFSAYGITLIFFIMGVFLNHPSFGTVLLYLPLFIIPIVISLPVWNFTYNNIDLVISRKMRYRKTETQIHEFRWLYATDRLLASALFIEFLFYEVFHILMMNIFQFYRDYWIPR